MASTHLKKVGTRPCLPLCGIPSSFYNSLQKFGLSPEQHRQWFRSLELAEAGRPFVLAQQLRDSCRKWLLAGGSDAETIIDKVVLEQFIS
uniref:SCAN box domain-containing protein n=1 Tax=Cyprinus carpio carpio TaxID=630221 RepID=A0A9J7XPL3_CYPCA